VLRTEEENLMNKRSLLAALGAGALGALSPCRALAQSYPAKPVRLVFPFPAGSQSEVFLRAIGEKFLESQGQPLVFDHKPGATGIIGSTLVRHAAPDGYTVLFAPMTSLVIAPSLLAKPPYDALRDFAPVTLLLRFPFFLVVNKDLPARTVAELVALARARPGKLSFGSIGNGSGNHLMAELFVSLTGIDATHVPYKGSVDAQTALIRGDIDFYFDAVAQALPHIQAGRIRGLAVTGAQRDALVPDTPTLAESGYQGFDVSVWWSIVAPLNTPPPIVTKLAEEFVRIMNLPDIRARLATQGWEPIAQGPAHLSRFLREEQPRWLDLVRRLNLFAKQ
jgi:tripartite-type tricarboxylate transporter receptor subunit TctC